MTKTLLDCGNCGPDFHAIQRMVTAHFGAAVLQSHGTEDTLRILRSRSIDLVTVNRKLDRDYSDGMDVVNAIQADPEVGTVPIMLVTNFEQHQQQAVRAGCVPGFGKRAIGDPATIALLTPFLGSPSDALETATES